MTAPISMGPLPDHLLAKARPCVYCDATGIDDGETCCYCRGARIRSGGILWPDEWAMLYNPTNTPVRFVREVQLDTIRQILPKTQTPEDLGNAAVLDCYTRLKNCLGSYNFGSCHVYEEPDQESAFWGVYVCREFDFPVAICAEQCRHSVTISVAATAIFS